MSISKDKHSVLIDELYIDKLQAKEIDISVLEVQYARLGKMTQNVQAITTKLQEHFYENIMDIIKESTSTIEEISVLIKEMTLSVFQIYSSKYMKKQSNDNKKKLIQLEVVLTSLLETIPQMIRNIVKYENKNAKKNKSDLRIEVSQKNLMRIEPEQQSTNQEADLLILFNESIGSYFDNDSSFQETKIELKKIKQCESDICKNIETIIDCVNQSQHEYSFIETNNKSRMIHSTTSVISNSWKKVIIVCVALLALCFICLPLYAIFKEVNASNEKA